MKIKSFEIENFRSLKKIKISDFGSTTIFYGDNNAGKSNILNALELIFSRKAKLTQEGPSDLENFYEGIVQDSRHSYYNNEVETPIKFTISLEVEKGELNIADDIKPLFNKGAKFEFTFDGDITFSSEEGDISNFNISTIKVGNTDIYLNKNGQYVYFPTLDKKSQYQSTFSKAFDRLIDIFSDCIHVVGRDRDMHETRIHHDEEKKLTPQTFKQFLYSLYLSPKKFHLFEQIDSVYSKEPFSFGTLSFSKDHGKLEIMVKEKDFRLPIKHLGSGALQCLYIITSVVCSKSKIVSLEELEQNLSPKKQYQVLRKVQQMIEDKGIALNQLILTSHSSVYSKNKLGTIYFIEKNDGKTSINPAEKQSISKGLKEHLAPSQFNFGEREMAEMEKYLKEEHDFR